MEGWNEEKDDLGSGVLNGRDANGELEHGGLGSLRLRMLFDDLKVCLWDVLSECV